MKRPFTRVCTTLLTQECLKAADDFLTAREIANRTGESMHRVGAALHFLRKKGAVDCLSVPVGQAYSLFWFLTLETDSRSRILTEIKAEIKKPKRRKKQNLPTSKESKDEHSLQNH
ncbi:MAG: hypothetical protein DA330_01005 [Nitrososphaera sp.]|nr:hypothetical protein [Nitrososphaera sp.]